MDERTLSLSLLRSQQDAKALGPHSEAALHVQIFDGIRSNNKLNTDTDEAKQSKHKLPTRGEVTYEKWRAREDLLKGESAKERREESRRTEVLNYYES